MHINQLLLVQCSS